MFTLFRGYHFMPTQKAISSIVRIPIQCSSFQNSLQKENFLFQAKLWNNLEPFLKLIQSVHIFKRLSRNQLLDNFVNDS